MQRNQFTFYRSYYEAISQLPKRERSAVLMAICGYALDEEEPELSGTAKAVFTLVKPTLDSGRKKAANRSDKTKSNRRQAQNKAISNQKQTPHKKEGEGELEKEAELEGDKESELKNECSVTPIPPCGGISPVSAGTERFSGELKAAVEDWLRYKQEKRQGYRPTGLKSLLNRIESTAALYGDRPTAEAIRASMAANYQGIVFDRLKQWEKSSNPFLQMLREEGQP